MRVLLVKLSSMGDLIHALPAITDAQNAIPGIQFDWVIDESFYEIALWHSGVENIIKSAHRRWRSNIYKTWRDGEFGQFRKQLRRQKYDLIIDAQGNFKSALVSRLARGSSAGLDKSTAAEAIASIAYQKRYHVAKEQHAITRIRELFAKALNYSQPNTMPDFAIQRDRLQPLSIELPSSFIFFVHNASWDSKLWPEAYWKVLVERARDDNLHVILPWGNASEKARAERLAAKQSHVMLLPKMALSQVAHVISRAKAVICCDTGFCHLAAALDIPLISLFGPTNPDRVGAMSHNSINLRADFPCAPCYGRKCTYTKPSSQQPACFTTLPPELVWEKLLTLL